jgi:putative oxidoreductase
MFKLFSPIHINRNLGLLVVRFGVGFTMLVFHGYDKLVGGPEVWARVGGSMQNLGIGFVPEFWGFMAAFAEFVCSLLIVLGVLFRPALIMLIFTMFVALIMHLNLPPENPGSGWSGAAHALELLFVYGGLYLTGPGKYAFSLMKKRDDY